MPIQVLSRELSERIAAGEVVDRPASVVKELVENSIDSGALSIEIELISNGLKYIRVTDDGSGIDRADVKTAFLRHATSKICKEQDLYSIRTLGFRGEALAAIAAVSRVRMITRKKNIEFATVYQIEGGIEVDFGIVGADTGTSVIVEDIFYNTPARMKFLKKDVSEGNAIQSLILQLILSHPEISFKFIRDKKIIYVSPGTGDLYDAAYSVLSGDISNGLLKVNYSEDSNGISVTGFISKPELSKKSRSAQYTFVNNRYVKSLTITAAVEAAYRNMNMQGRFPVFIINVKMPYENVDVNVHPSKTEVRFSNERDVFHAVYQGASFTLAELSANVLTSLGIKEVNVNEPDGSHTLNEKNESNFSYTYSSGADIEIKTSNIYENLFNKERNIYAESSSYSPVRVNLDINPEEIDNPEEYEDKCITSKAGLKIIGEIFETYILAEWQDNFILIDKHAAHERILFEEIQKRRINESRQVLLEPEVIAVTPDEKDVLLEFQDLLMNLGFAVEEFGINEIAVREVPIYFGSNSVKDAIDDLAEQLKRGITDPRSAETVWMLNTISCKAAIRAGHRTSVEEMLKITDKILCGAIPKYCPHGRQVFIVFTKQELDKRFGRL